jgi:hypothetical protein
MYDAIYPSYTHTVDLCKNQEWVVPNKFVEVAFLCFCLRLIVEAKLIILFLLAGRHVIPIAGNAATLNLFNWNTYCLPP